MKLLSLIESQMRARPEALAIVHGDRKLTYRQVQTAARCIAQGLLQEGVEPGSLVAIYLHRTPELLAALLAVWQIGAAYLPLDPEHHAERTAFMIEDSGARFLLSETSLLPKVPHCQARVLNVHTLAASTPRSLPLPGSFSAEDLANVIYTSGSTGKPKGAMISHRSLANTMYGLQRDLQVVHSDILLASNSIAFDISGQEMYLPLIHGASIHLVERDVPADGVRLRQVLENAGITIMMGLGTSYRLLLDAGWQGNHHLQLTVGGEALPLELARRLAQRCRALWNHYGPTETSICATSERIDPAAEKITLGRPLANVRIYVLDQHGERVPPGSAGEIHIGGEGVGLGYRNRPALTAASFVPDPFADLPGATMYKTGDQGMLLVDGRLDFLGRFDEQVKIRGFRIEMEEVGAALEDCTNVTAAVVRAIEFAPGDKRLIAFFVATRTIESDSLRSFLRQRLPHYMVPSEFLQLAAFPLMPSGKVDRRALDSLRLQSVTADPASPAAAGDIEATLERIWLALFRVRHIRASDNFFDLGGHSLLAARMFAQVEKQLGITVPASLLLEHPTIVQLAHSLRLRAAGKSSLLVKLQPGGGRAPLFVAHGIGGSLLTFRVLAQALGADQPIYGLTVPASFDEMGGGGPGPDLIQRLAASYVQHIRAIAPLGPYQLAGHSSAGLVLVEVAHQLRRQGSQVHLLALLDADIGHAGSTEKSFSALAMFLRFLHRNLRDVQRSAQIGVRTWARRKLDHYKRKFQLTLLQRWPRHSRHFSVAFVTEGYLVLALDTFRPHPYPGDVVHFQAQAEPRRHHDPDLGWRPYVAGALENVMLPGDHHSIFAQPNVQTFAAELHARLHRAVGDSEATPRLPVTQATPRSTRLPQTQYIEVEA